MLAKYDKTQKLSTKQAINKVISNFKDNLLY